jgi:hypothetical protein
MFINYLNKHCNPFASNQSGFCFLLQLVWYFVTRPEMNKTISLKSKHESDLMFLKEKQTLMPPYEEWKGWFKHVWETAFESGEDGHRRYYYFVNFILKYVCYPFGKAEATRAGGRRTTEVEATSGVIDDDTFGYTFPTFPLKRGIDRDDLGGKYLKSHWLMKSDLNFGHLFVLHIR